MIQATNNLIDNEQHIELIAKNVDLNVINDKLQITSKNDNNKNFIDPENKIKSIPLRKSVQRIVLGILILTFTIVAGSSSTAITSSLNLKNPVLKLAWRQTCMLPYLIILAIIELRFFEKQFRLWDYIKKWENIKSLSIIGVYSNLMSLGYIWSAEYTIIGHSCLFAGLGGAFIVIFQLIRRQFIHRFELQGTIISIAGCVIALFDSRAEKVNQVKQNILLGDCIAVIGSIFAAVYFMNQGRLMNSNLPPFTCNALLFISAVISINLFGIIVLPDFEANMKPEVGAFAFLTPEYALYSFTKLGIVAGCFTFAALGYLVKEFSPLVMCTAYLVEPFFAQIASCFLGLDKIPGILSAIGCVVTLVGMYLVGLGNKKRQESGK